MNKNFFKTMVLVVIAMMGIEIRCSARPAETNGEKLVAQYEKIVYEKAGVGYMASLWNIRDLDGYAKTISQEGLVNSNDDFESIARQINQKSPLFPRVKKLEPFFSGAQNLEKAVKDGCLAKIRNVGIAATLVIIGGIGYYVYSIMKPRN